MTGNNLELLEYGYGGMLSDGSDNVIEKLYEHILDHPQNLLSYGSCLSGGNSYNDCVVKVGKEICKDTGDADLCELVAKAELVNDTSKALANNEPFPKDNQAIISSQKPDISLLLTDLITDFKDMDCSKMSDLEKEDLVNRLNELEQSFKLSGREAEFNLLIEKLKCDVVEEFKCGDIDVKFETEPVCNPKFIKVWGKPILVGSATGVCVGFGWYHIANGPATHSILAGIIAGAGMTYYLKNRHRSA